MPTVMDAERIRWETIEQLFVVEGTLLTMVREQTSVRGINVADLFTWIMTAEGSETVTNAIELILKNYSRQK